jgi:hypothetical protein
MNELIPTKEVKQYETQIAEAASYSTSLIVNSPEDYQAALEEGKRIKVTIDSIVSRKEEITKPLNASLKSIRDLFKPFETAGENALTTIKTKMLTYTREEARKADEAKQKLVERVERGTMKSETAVRKMGEMTEPEKTVKTETAKATTRTVIKYRVTDKSKIPLQFLEPDMVAIKAEFKKGSPVAGVEAYEEQELSIG